MAEITVTGDLKRSIETAKWSETGVNGFLTGKVWRNHTYVLNLWKSVFRSNKVTGMVDEVAFCHNHLCGGSSIVGVIFVSKSEGLTEAENQLSSLPPEVQTAVTGSHFVVCLVRPGPKQAEVSFHYLCMEDVQLRELNVFSDVSRLAAGLVTFRLQAYIPLLVYVDNARPGVENEWEEKIDKTFAHTDLSIQSGFMYRLRGSSVFLSCEGDVMGVREPISTVQQLCQTAFSDTDSKSKNTVKTPQMVMVDLYQAVSGNSGRFAQPTCAPAIHLRSGSFRTLELSLPLDVLVEADVAQKLSELVETFTVAVRSQLQAMRHCLVGHHFKENEFYTPEPVHFNIPNRHTCITVIYPKDVPDTRLDKRRLHLHEKMCLSLERPVFRRQNARLFPGQTTVGGYLVNPHLGLAPSGVQGGQTHLVQGNYTYHHYMQDKIDDNKWGCAYRSLQTLVSWFRLQGYTDRPVPSHKEIQQALVAVGDKEPSFVGSKNWIGSFEVSYCLEHLIGVTSRFLNVATGAELASKGRELAQHFDTQGTPVMIGGGVLAHTILGVDYSQTSGDISFLILDPHYMGGEDLLTIQKEGWCGWKPPTFWDAMAHYNLCLPQRPRAF